MLFTEHFDDLMSLDGVPLDFDASLRVQVTDSVALVDKFGVSPDQRWCSSGIAPTSHSRFEIWCGRKSASTG